MPAHNLPPRLRRPVGVNWVGPGGHVVHYLLRGGEILNFVGIVERSGWHVESWTAPGTTEECLDDFAGWHDDVLFMIDHVETPYKWALLSREPLRQWSYGRVTLLGDAAHPTLPMMAQGANMALEDALVLARCVESFRTDVATGLKAYESMRIDRTSRLVHAANNNAKRFHNPILGSLQGAKTYVETEWREDKVKERYDWVFSYDPTTTPVVAN